MHRFTPRKPDSNWSESNKKRARRLIDAGLMASAGLKMIELAQENGKWTASATTPSKFSMPPEFDTRLKRNSKARTFFAALAPSYQQQYIAWIASAKRPDTRKKRVDEAMELLKRGEKLGMR
jgi:uncharacterized protein YdeI (YjbR/CyaY-like superfamily)